MTIEIQKIRNVAKNYGVRVTNLEYGAESHSTASIHTAVWTMDYNNLPAPGVNNLQQVIPAGSTIVRALLRVVTAFAGGTSYTVGLAQADGTPISATGLFTAANLPLASLTPAGKLVTGTGALVGAVSSATLDGELVVAASGTFTAGRAEIIVEYLTPAAVPA